jgi:hypothetical protein
VNRPSGRSAELAGGALRTLGFDGDFAKLHGLIAARLGFAGAVPMF